MSCFIGVPNTPVFDVISSENENDCAVFVRWLREPSSSDCPVLFHTISYRRQGENEWTTLNITGRNTDREKIKTDCSTEYEFQVLAWNDVGPSPITTKTYTTKGSAIKNNGRGICTYNVQMVVVIHCIERFDMTSLRPY